MNRVHVTDAAGGLEFRLAASVMTAPLRVVADLGERLDRQTGQKHPAQFHR
jgi:hypothetical protein